MGLTVGEEEDSRDQSMVSVSGNGEGGAREILCARLREQVEQCKAEFEAKKADNFGGTILDAELDMLQALCKRLEEGEEMGELLARVRKMQGELEEAREKEDVCATFDWYDDHYYWKVYDGQVRACRIVRKLLESWEEECGHL